MFSSVPVAKTEEKPTIPLSDRVANSEAMLLSFLAEKSLPFSLAGDLLELVKELSKDKKALDSIKMHRTTASYKLRFGVAKTFKESLIEDLKKEKFSINTDESTRCNNEKIVTVLVNYFKDDSLMTEHLKSFSVTTTDSKTISGEIIKLFEENNIPWDNLMSVLLDSCNVMRGKKAGVETRLRDKCHHLLDIDGDSCHHAHNAAKKFCKEFNHHLESLFQDLFNDFKWSPDLRAAFSEICQLLNIRYTVPKNYVPYRWLSVYDVAQDFSQMYDAFMIFYFSFLSKDDKLNYLHEIVKIFRKKGFENPVKEHIKKIQATLAGKNLTESGKHRKNRIVKKLFICSLQTKLVLSLYLSVLPLLKEYIILFQTSKPLIHKLHDKQVELLKSFLACFIKPECLKLAGNDPIKIKKLDVKKGINHLSVKSMFIGEKARELISLASKASQCHVKSFESACIKAYIACSESLLAKMPITNNFLQAVSAVDPLCRQHSLSLKLMKDLPNLVTNVILPEEKELFELEVQNYHADSLLPQINENESIDEWWAKIRKSSNYPLLSKMTCALLTCFHGPRVESSFSIMNHILTPGTSRLNIETFDSIQSIKYHLLASKKTSISYFAKKEFLHDAVKKHLVKNLNSACRSYESEKISKRKLKENVLINLSLKKQKTLSREAAKKICSNAAKMQRFNHYKKCNKKNLKKPKEKENTEKPKHLIETKNSKESPKKLIQNSTQAKKATGSKIVQITTNVVKKRSICVSKDKEPPRKKQKLSLSIKEMFEKAAKLKDPS